MNFCLKPGKNRDVKKLTKINHNFYKTILLLFVLFVRTFSLSFRLNLVQIQVILKHFDEEINNKLKYFLSQEIN